MSRHRQTRSCARRTAAPSPLAAIALLLPLAASAEPLSLVETLREGVDGVEGIARIKGLAVTDDQLIATGTSFDLFERDAASGRLTLIHTLDAPPSSSTPLERGEVRRVQSPANLADDTVIVTGGVGDPDICVTRSLCTGAFGLFSTSDGSLDLVQTRFPDITFSSVVPSPDGRNLYAPLAGAPGLQVLQFDSLNEVVPVQFIQRVRTDGAAEGIRQVIVSNDGSRVFALTGTGGYPGTLTTLERGDDGRLTSLFTLPIPDIPSVNRINEIALAADGTTLYASAYELRGDSDAGLLPLRVMTDGTLVPRDVVPSLSTLSDYSLSSPGAVAVSENGRLIFTGNRISVGGGAARSVHLFTADGDDVVWRGLEGEGKDGVLPRTLRDISVISLSPDDAFLYVGSLNENTLSIFAVHADTRADIEATASVTSETTATASARVFNAGPAVAHGVSMRIESSVDILSTSAPNACRVDGRVATCGFDELRPLDTIDLGLTLVATLGDAPALSLETTQYQTDLAMDSNTANATLRVLPPVIDAPSVDSSPVGAPLVDVSPADAPPADTPLVDMASSGGSGGCSIGGDGERDPSLPLLALGALVALVRTGTRRSRSGPSLR